MGIGGPLAQKRAYCVENFRRRGGPIKKALVARTLSTPVCR